MSKRRSHEEEQEKDTSERWMLTYSDLITLLLALFIILYTISTTDLQKMQALSQGLSQAFNNDDASVNMGGSGSGSLIEDDDSSSLDSSDDSDNGNVRNQALDLIFNEITEYIKTNDLQEVIDVENYGTYVKIVLRDTILFEPDSPVMLDESKPILSEIEKVLVKVYDDIGHITITGYTADVSNQGKYSTEFDWTLSTNRALTVLNYLNTLGIAQDKFSVEGRSHYEAVASNDTEEGRKKNRRVEFVITSEYSIN